MIFKNIIQTLLSDPVHLRVFGVLYGRSEGVTGREIGRMVRTSSFKISRVMRLLVAQGVVVKTPVGMSNLYLLDERRILVRDVVKYLIEYEKNLLPKLGYGVMRRLKKRPLAVVLYGSMARGDERPASDIDLMLVHGHGANLGADSGALSEWITRTYGNSAAVTTIPVARFLRPPPTLKPLIRNIMKEGKSIAGLSMTELINYGRKKT